MDKIKVLYLFLKGEWKTSVPGALIMLATGLYAFDYIDSTKYGVICAVASGIIGLVAADAKTVEEKKKECDDLKPPVVVEDKKEEKGNVNDY